MIVELTMAEIMQAANVGVMRRIQRLKSGIHLRHGLKTGSEWQLFIDGALAECAFAKFMNVYWQGCGDINGDDVGEYEVRSTRHENGMLLIHKSDKDDSKYYLLTGCEGKYKVRGWMYGRDAKQDKYWKQVTERPPSFYIPQNELNPV